MTPEQKAAFIQSQVACAQAEIAAMQAENAMRAVLGQSMAYEESDFTAVPLRYGIHHNAVVEFFRD